MKINSNPTFKAQFLHTDSLKQVVEYSLENKCFNKLNNARKEIEKHDGFVKIEMHCGFDEKLKRSFLKFITYKPQYETINNQLIQRYKIKETIKYYSEKNPLKLAYEKIIQMSQNNLRNNTYKNII